jgi:hypothetical protein
MGLILSEPMKKVVGIPKILAKFSIEDAKIHAKRPYRLRTSPGRKGRKKNKTSETVFLRKSCVFACLALICLHLHPTLLIPLPAHQHGIILGPELAPPLLRSDGISPGTKKNR